MGDVQMANEYVWEPVPHYHDTKQKFNCLQE